MWILNTCDFASTTENGALILYFWTFLVFIIWTKRGVIEKTLKRVSWKGGVFLERGGGFQIVSSVSFQKSMFSLVLEYFSLLLSDKYSRLLQSIDLFFHEVYFLLENDILWNFFSSYSNF